MSRVNAKYAYDVSTGEHVLLGRTNAPQRESFTPEALAKQEKQRKRRERKQRQRARKRAEKQEAQKQGAATTTAAETAAATPSDQPPRPKQQTHPTATNDAPDVDISVGVLSQRAATHLYEHRDIFTASLLHTIRHAMYGNYESPEDKRLHVHAACLLLKRQATTLATLSERCQGQAGCSIEAAIRALQQEAGAIALRMDTCGERMCAERVRVLGFTIESVFGSPVNMCGRRTQTQPSLLLKHHMSK